MEKSLIQRLESAVRGLESLSGGPPSDASPAIGGDASSVPSVMVFEDLMNEYVGRIVSAAETIGGEVFDVTKVLEEGFSVQRDLIIQMKHSQKPDKAGLGAFLKPLNEVITKANEMTGGKRSKFFSHLKTVAASMSALAWIAYTGKDCGMSMPAAHVEECWQSAEFYCNKVLAEYRNKDPNHVEWAKALKELYTPGLRNYVKAHYPLGPVWNATGKTIESAPSSSPAPPPAPSASLSSSGTSKPSSSNSEGMDAVFKEISSGSVTAGLSKVTDDMKTKNRPDRGGAVTTTGKESPTGSFSSTKTGPPKLELQMGRKWVVENQTGIKDLTIADCDAEQTVYIFNCTDSILQIRGKVNDITIDKCDKMGVVFTDVVVACEIVDCNCLEVRCEGIAPTISIDNTTGCQFHLSKDSLKSSITTAKSREINMSVPGDTPEKDMLDNRTARSLHGTITGRNPIDYCRSPREMNLVDWFKVMVASRRGEELVDSLIEVHPPLRALKHSLLVCLRCIDLDPSPETAKDGADLYTCLRQKTFLFVVNLVQLVRQLQSTPPKLMLRKVHGCLGMWTHGIGNDESI